MFTHLKEYFTDEMLIFKNDRKLEEKQQNRMLFLHILSYIFIFLFICKILYII